jgi:hypothetical protein
MVPIIQVKLPSLIEIKDPFYLETCKPFILNKTFLWGAYVQTHFFHLTKDFELIYIRSNNKR